MYIIDILRKCNIDRVEVCGCVWKNEKVMLCPNHSSGISGGSKTMEGQFDKLEGKKHDDGKPSMALLSSDFLLEVSKVLDFGAKKYDAWNWKKGFKWSRVMSAVLRHIFAWLKGEDKDPESGISHLAHASCGLMFLIDFEVNKIGTDDRIGK